ncbi:VMAP-C domain-containing protein, partial [Streptomyces mirabilis]|uniref:VMAP-C domain-containing protein n=1 Tax=Streptomyces mirabilis TaxID=68239 RepID=UPI0036A25547
VVLGRYAGPVVPAPVVAQRRLVSVVFRLEDTAWAVWMARLLEAAGCEAVLRTWHTDDELRIALARPPQAASNRPHQVVRLLGDGTDSEAMRLDAALNRVISVDLDVDVSTDGAFYGLARGPGLTRSPLSSLSEGLARRWLFNQLGIDADASLLGSRDAEYPGPTRFVEGPLPERSPGHVLQEGALDELRVRLVDQRRTARPCALVGPLGTGKTQLAAEYVHRFADEYDFVAWISARDRDTRFDEMGELSLKISDCLDREPDLPQVKDMFTRRLPEENLHWLIVYDGWDDLRDADRFPLSGGHVLITSRDPGWADTADVLRLTDTGEGPTGPAAARDELVRRALVRVDASSGTASGFFLAPGWAVTASAVVRARYRGSFVEVTMMDGSRHQAEKVVDVGNLALLHVPAVVNVDCLWLTDRPVARAGAVFLCWAAGSRNTPREFRTSAMAFEPLRKDTFTLDGVHLPPGSAGGPVLDAGDGSLIGVVVSRREDGTGEAIRIEALRALCDQGTANTELWHGIIRAHDRHHYDRFMDRGSRLTWTGVQAQVSGGLGPKTRTELYGLLAELEPPVNAEAVQALLDDPRLRTDRIPRHWRDGAGCVRHRIADDCIFLYAARVWAQLAPRSGPDQAPVLTALRDWIEATARTSVTSDALQDIADVFACVDVTFTARGPVVRVEIERVGLDRSYGWRVVLRQDGEDAIQVEDMSGRSEFEVQDRLLPHVADALVRADTVAARAAVQFCLPSELLWDLPVEDWPVRQSDALGEERAVFVRAQDALGRSSQERRRRWEAVAKGPLQGARMGSRRRIDEPRPDWVKMPLNTVPLLCRHLDVPAVTTDIDLVRSLGYPLILWSRSAAHADCAEFYEWAEELLHQSGTARELIAQVGRLRSRRHVWARRLAVYCDPPDEDR